MRLPAGLAGPWPSDGGDGPVPLFTACRTVPWSRPYQSHWPLPGRARPRRPCRVESARQGASARARHVPAPGPGHSCHTDATLVSPCPLVVLVAPSLLICYNAFRSSRQDLSCQDRGEYTGSQVCSEYACNQQKTIHLLHAFEKFAPSTLGKRVEHLGITARMYSGDKYSDARSLWQSEAALPRDRCRG